MRITKLETGGIEATKRALSAAVKAAALATVEQWHREYLPGHFTTAGFEKYGYQLRKGQDESSLIYSDQGRAVRMGKGGRLVNNPKYYWRKWRQKRTHDPLVFTGQSKQSAEQSIRLSAQNVSAEGLIRGQGVMDLPRYFYQYNPATGAPDKADELLRTTPDEEASLQRYFGADLQQRVAAASLPTTRSRVA